MSKLTCIDAMPRRGEAATERHPGLISAGTPGACSTMVLCEARPVSRGTARVAATCLGIRAFGRPAHSKTGDAPKIDILPTDSITCGTQIRHDWRSFTDGYVTGSRALTDDPEPSSRDWRASLVCLFASGIIILASPSGPSKITPIGRDSSLFCRDGRWDRIMSRRRRGGRHRRAYALPSHSFGKWKVSISYNFFKQMGDRKRLSGTQHRKIAVEIKRKIPDVINKPMKIDALFKPSVQVEQPDTSLNIAADDNASELETRECMV
ncbi:hypothetical protein J6590_092287 [Homalodisca vitripennis]|nr:hypothetical protein J6590_023555 [Homalodisca vitripennis]KAG8334356.1 hypothetical protein J6590_092287 [Homalodisca vitripennis]